MIGETGAADGMPPERAMSQAGAPRQEALAAKAPAALFEKYPFLRILTGDALFAGNPLC